MPSPENDCKTRLAILRDLYQQKVPFNRLLGFNVGELEEGRAEIGFSACEALIGNPVFGTLHGGVISAVLDTTGGLTASTGIIAAMTGCEIGTINQKLAKVGTIDLRVDYLRPGRGSAFKATGHIMRAGRKVTVTRMELHNDQRVLIAVGTGTYMVA